MYGTRAQEIILNLRYFIAFCAAFIEFKIYLHAESICISMNELVIIFCFSLVWETYRLQKKNYEAFYPI